jgi:hypothetical protein
MRKRGKRVKVKKFSSLMNAALLEQVKKQAAQNGQTVRFLLEAAIRHYVEVVVPSSQGVHSDALHHLRASAKRNAGLMRLLAKAE